MNMNFVTHRNPVEGSLGYEYKRENIVDTKEKEVRRLY
jgi:hypothetical protein